MSTIKLLFIAVGLSADAFAVSVAEGVALEEVRGRHMLRLSMMFGLFQGLMPILGWSLGQAMRGFIEPFDHWVAFALLALIGGKMVADALLGFETGAGRAESRGLRLLVLAVATSIDALAVGMSIAMLRVHIWTPALVIAAVTGVLCAIGVHAGKSIGTRIGRRAEVVGGFMLIGVGVKVLLDHLL